jgi:hypothetical protein
MKFFSHKKVGGIHFIKVGRLNLGFSMSRKKRTKVAAPKKVSCQGTFALD